MFLLFSPYLLLYDPSPCITSPQSCLVKKSQKDCSEAQQTAFTEDTIRFYASDDQSKYMAAHKKYSVTMDTDDKHAKFRDSQLEESKALIRRLVFYILLFSLVADIYVSKAAVLDHLTLWSWSLHTLYFELHLPASPTLTKLLHGPSFTGAHALFFMYIWTMIANPNMEFDLAPPGRAVWFVYVRAFYMHLFPIIFHWMDLMQNQALLAEIYNSPSFLARDGYLFQFWACIGGYFAMGLTWEQFNGNAAATYNIEIVDDATYVLISKVIGVASCIVSFLHGLRPRLFKVEV